ncbi:MULTISPECIES: thioredoxin family protein [unclassified Streptomyces]|uniref:thioredoxin family protein n=1 Tax=unclassified Streptomyces TaxID=2593676 RepID=UPI000BAC9E60|nr:MULTISPECIES: thioredoxin family protein [unclassified Streptomyces]ASY31396.1 thioredoxin [Streptomyces sp. CLI2509]MYX19579.1 thioredoxin [Streptomyces sp. SID8380]
MTREGGATHVRERDGEGESVGEPGAVRHGGAAETGAGEPGAVGSGAVESGAVGSGAVGNGPAQDWARVFASGALGDVRLGERATLVQFSTAFCQPCRATRRVLDQVAGLVPGVAHVEIDAEDHLALVRTAGIEATPTVLFLDASGREVRRAGGAPRRDQVLTALARML